MAAVQWRPVGTVIEQGRLVAAETAPFEPETAAVAVVCQWVQEVAGW